MTLMGGPIDTRVNPTAVNKLAEERGIDWFRRNVITKVPFPHPGVMRDVYPGFLQLNGFMTHEPRPPSSRRTAICSSIWSRATAIRPQKHREFYDEYLAVMDLTAEFYLQTVETVFIRHALPKGEMMHRGQPVDPATISARRAAHGRGRARRHLRRRPDRGGARRSARTFRPTKKAHYLQPGVGHYGVFNGSRFRSEIAPRISDFILSSQGRESGHVRRTPPEGRRRRYSSPGADWSRAIRQARTATPISPATMRCAVSSSSRLASDDHRPCRWRRGGIDGNANSSMEDDAACSKGCPEVRRRSRRDQDPNRIVGRAPVSLSSRASAAASSIVGQLKTANAFGFDHGRDVRLGDSPAGSPADGIDPPVRGEPAGIASSESMPVRDRVVIRVWRTLIDPIRPRDTDCRRHRDRRFQHRAERHRQTPDRPGCRVPWRERPMTRVALIERENVLALYAVAASSSVRHGTPPDITVMRRLRTCAPVRRAVAASESTCSVEASTRSIANSSIMAIASPGELAR